MTCARARTNRSPSARSPFPPRRGERAGSIKGELREQGYDILPRMTRKLIAACLCVLALAGCAKEETPPKTMGAERKTLLIGLIPEQNIFKQIERYEPLAGYLSRNIGVKITLKILPPYVDKATTAGYLFPIEYLRHNGISDCGAFLKECYFAGTHEDAIEDVLDKKADIGAAKNTVFNRLAKSNPRIREELVVLSRSLDVPENGIALRKDIDESLRNRLKEALLNMHRDPDGKRVLDQFEAQKFIETTNQDYGVVIRYAEQIGLDLSTYDYINY